MTLEAFEAKWGGPLRAAGISFAVDDMGRAVFIGGIRFDKRDDGWEVVAEASARGLLVAWAAERGYSVERLCWHEFGEPIGEGWGMSDGDALVSSNDFADFDAALIAGCIALAKQEAAK